MDIVITQNEKKNICTSENDTEILHNQIASIRKGMSSVVLFDVNNKKFEEWEAVNVEKVVDCEGREVFINGDNDLLFETLSNNFYWLFGSDPIDFSLDVAIGNKEGISSLCIEGNNDNVGVTFSDIWCGQGNKILATEAEVWEVVSDNANDTLLGIGAQKVLITSLDLSYNEKTTIVDLNGLTPVILPGTHFRDNSFSVKDVGAAGQSGTNIGNITLRVSGGGNIKGIIKSDRTSAFNSHFTVPLGKTLAWVQSSSFGGKGNDALVRSRFQIGGTGPFVVGVTIPIYQSTIIVPFKAPLLLPEKSEIFYQAKSTNMETLIATKMDFFILDNVLINN